MSDETNNDEPARYTSIMTARVDAGDEHIGWALIETVHSDVQPVGADASDGAMSLAFLVLGRTDAQRHDELEAECARLLEVNNDMWEERRVMLDQLDSAMAAPELLRAEVAQLKAAAAMERASRRTAREQTRTAEKKAKAARADARKAKAEQKDAERQLKALQKAVGKLP